MLFGLICVSGLVYLWWVWQQRTRRLKGMNLPPMYPGALPFVGHAHLLIGNTTQLWTQGKKFANETLKRGGVLCGLLGTDLYYLIADPEDTVIVLNTCLQKHFAYDFAKSWIGDGLVTAPVPVWKRHRKLLNPAFSLQVLYGFLGVFNSQSRNLVSDLAAEVGRGPFNHLTYLKNIAFKTIFLSVLGVTAKEDHEFNNTYMQAVDQILNIIVLRFQNIWLHNQYIYSWSALKKREDAVIKVLNNMSNTVIQRKKALLKNKNLECAPEKNTTGTECKAFMDLMIELSEQNLLTDQEIQKEVDTFIAAGYETSSYLLTYTLMLLGTYSQTQEKMYKELQEVFGDSDRDVEKEDLSNLVYTEAVIKETLRLYPVVPVLLKYVDKDVQLKNYTMRAGSHCAVLTYAAHRHPMWGADAEQFKPERWLSPETLPDCANAFAGFSLGKRSCIGKAFATMSIKTTLAHVLRRYRVTADVSKLVLKVDFVLKPASGHQIVLEERNQNMDKRN